MSSMREAIAHGNLSVQVFKVAKKYEGDPDVQALLRMLKEFDEERRKNIGLPERAQIERRTKGIKEFYR